MRGDRFALASAFGLGPLLAVVAASLGVACSPRHETSESAQKSVTFTSCGNRLALPRAAISSSYQHWHLLVSKSGSKRWNGQNVDAATLARYMVDLSKMRADVGNLIVHLEPGISCGSIKEINQILRNSPLCAQHRCFQDRWDYKQPIVN